MLFKYYPKLFSRKGGVVTFWSICVDHTGEHPTICINTGEVDGKIKETKEVIRDGLNVGKDNELTPMKLAMNKAKTMWVEQINKGFNEKGRST